MINLDEMLDMGRTGRAELMRRIRQLVAEVRAARCDRQELLDNLTATQTRCTELLNAVRELRGGLPLPGWTCRSETCASKTHPEGGTFNGSAKGSLTHCRGCGAPRPT